MPCRSHCTHPIRSKEESACAQAYDPRFGARPLRRWLEHNEVTELSRQVISGALPENSVVTVDDAGPSAPQRLKYTVTPGEPTPSSNGNGTASSAGKRGRVALDFPANSDLDDEDMLDQ